MMKDEFFCTYVLSNLGGLRSSGMNGGTRGKWSEGVQE